MNYKGYDIHIKEDWKFNLNPPLSRYIIFEVSKNNEKVRFVFNHGLLNDMAEEAGGIKTDEEKFQDEAIEEIKKIIDKKLIEDRKMNFYELYSQNFMLVNTPPDWFMKRNWN